MFGPPPRQNELEKAYETENLYVAFDRESFCRHTPHCGSIWSHKMLLSAEGFVDAMERRALDALMRHGDHAGSDPKDHGPTQTTKPVATSHTASKQWQQKNQRKRAPRKHGRKD